MTGLFPPLPPETRKILDHLPGLVDKTFPLPSRFRSGLPKDVAELSRLLTSGRQDRGSSYLGKPPLLSAYLRYFMPWNIYRLCRLFSNLPLDLKSGDAVNDLGAGPLTLASSLWISRPDLRTVPLEFRCIDRTPAVLDAGKMLFRALAAIDKSTDSSADKSTDKSTDLSAECPWTIKTIKGEIQKNRLSVEIRGKPAALIAAVNLYNELFWDFSPRDTERLESFAESQARLLSSLTASSILVVEPGIPRSGEFISLLRSSLISLGHVPLSPCTHQDPCPMQGGQLQKTQGKAKWCHFAFDTNDAPSALHKLSAAAGIPKERAVLSFQFTSAEKITQNKHSEHGEENARIISDPFPVSRGEGQNTWGRYGCHRKGLVLVRGSKSEIEKTASGSLKIITFTGETDPKSGALIVYHRHPIL